MRARPLAVRLWEKVDMSGACWMWTGTRTRGGYGHIRDGRKLRQVHRVVYELACGPIPDGLDIAHRCDNPACVRPEHLFPATHAENMSDMKAKGRGNSGYRGVTHCKHGHAFTPENTYRKHRPDGGVGRECRRCRNAQVSAHHQRRLAARTTT